MSSYQEDAFKTFSIAQLAWRDTTPNELRRMLCYIPTNRQHNVVTAHVATLMDAASFDSGSFVEILNYFHEDLHTQAQEIQTLILTYSIFGNIIVTSSLEQPESFLAILNLYPEKRRLKVFNQVKDRILEYPKSLRVMLDSLSESERIDVAKRLVNEMRYNTNRESIFFIIDLLSEDQLIEAINQDPTNHTTALHILAVSANKLIAYLNHYPIEQRLDALKIRDYLGQPVLQWAYNDPISIKTILDYYPAKERVSELNKTGQLDNTILHNAADYPESIKTILNYYPQEQWLNTLKKQNGMYGTLLALAARKGPNGFLALLRLYPKDELMDEINNGTRNSPKSILEFAIYCPQNLIATLNSFPSRRTSYNIGKKE